MMEQYRRTLGMTAFKNYCTEHAGAVFTYDSRNNASLCGTSHAHAAAAYSVFHVGRYDRAVIMLNPHRICFLNEYTSVTFNDVEEIIVTRAYPQDFYDTIYIFCKGDAIRYTIVVDELIRDA